MTTPHLPVLVCEVLLLKLCVLCPTVLLLQLNAFETRPKHADRPGVCRPFPVFIPEKSSLLFGHLKSDFVNHQILCLF